MRIVMATMEYAGIAEAGGVKNVARSLSESLSRLGHEVFVATPRFGCSCLDAAEDLREDCFPPISVSVNGSLHSVSFLSGRLKGGKIQIVFVDSRCFSEKLGVYTYTAREEERDPRKKRGQGHSDSKTLNALFCKSVAELSKKIDPDIALCQDAPAALIPQFISLLGLRAKCVVTIHNAGPAYHHEFSSIDEAQRYTSIPREILLGALNGSRVEPFLLAAQTAALSTVSKQYADELRDCAFALETDGLSQIFAQRKIPVVGITNGIDFARYDPRDTSASLLPFAFDPESGDLEGKWRCREFFLSRFARGGAPGDCAEGVSRFGSIETDGGGEGLVYFGYHGRLASQKGVLVLADAARAVAEKHPEARFVVAGQGEAAIEERMESLSRELDGRFLYLKGYDRAMSRLVCASLDFLVLPSHFEPCGLEDFIAQIYGTLPVAHATGGLQKIIDGETGFLFRPDTSERLAEILDALAGRAARGDPGFSRMARSAARTVREKYSWDEIARGEYVPLFESLLKK